jgi:hypothetical protein
MVGRGKIFWSELQVSATLTDPRKSHLKKFRITPNPIETQRQIMSWKKALIKGTENKMKSIINFGSSRVKTINPFRCDHKTNESCFQLFTFD